ncbi:MAG: bis(5'-nucleosyl)-tetraphosphatase (symmetrical) YqeK [Oscillospiraceae bacterium]|jgi:nicotinate-nucleotide adenylyltransferase|nr:bis(5'-nucleosyl)-tetraphosphatase (symmetrical) YqeK [Oscillospiraceae bacterium]
MQNKTAGRIGIFGGTFAPPHIGHLRAAEYFHKAAALDLLLIFPAGQAPLKDAPGLCAQDRLELCRRTFSCPVSDWETRRPGKSYTIDTLRHVRGAYPGARLFLLVGADQAAQFARWKDYDEILRLCTVCALRRDDCPVATDLPIRVLPGFVPVDISAARLRAMADPSPWMTPAAADYYALRQLLPPARVRHSECVSVAARQLALQTGANPAKAAFAGLWHDCAKAMPFNVQADWCARAGMPLTAHEVAAPQVCHAFAGAAWLACNKNITDSDILGAVRWHTTGHAGMTLPEEVVFVADLISADRSYPDVETVRALAAQSLHAASVYILEFVFSKLKAQGKPVHPDSLAWYHTLTDNHKGEPYGTP